MVPDTTFRDSYLLDLPDLTGVHSERDLESAILCEIEAMLLKLDAGFTFVAPQNRMTLGKDNFQLDLLLFFHRHLRRLIAVELKVKSFGPAHVGQTLKLLDSPRSGSQCRGSRCLRVQSTDYQGYHGYTEIFDHGSFRISTVRGAALSPSHHTDSRRNQTPRAQPSRGTDTASPNT